MSLKLAGRVTLDGLPEPSAVVEIHNATDDIIDQVQVDSNGSFTYHLAAGRWTLVAWDAHGNRGRAVVMLEDTDQTVEVSLSPGQGGSAP
jgi:hypothetical protein